VRYWSMVQLCAMSSVLRSIFTRSSWNTSMRAGSNRYRFAVTEKGRGVGPCSCAKGLTSRPLATRSAPKTTAGGRRGSMDPLDCTTKARGQRSDDGGGPLNRPPLQFRGLRFWYAGARFFLQERLAAEANLSSWVDVDHLYQDLLALLQLVANVLDAVVRDFRHVEQAVGAGHDFDEGAEVGDALNFSQIGFVELRCGRQLLDDGYSLARRRLVGRRHVHASIVFDVDLYAGPLDDASDHLAARSDVVANLVDRAPDGDDARGERGDVRARRGKRFAHLLEDVQASPARLVESLAHDVGGDA